MNPESVISTCLLDACFQDSSFLSELEMQRVTATLDYTGHKRSVLLDVYVLPLQATVSLNNCEVHMWSATTILKNLGILYTYSQYFYVTTA